MKLWGGRFSKDTDEWANDFNSSIYFDKRLFGHDIDGSIAHAKMLGKIGILTDEETSLIIKELTSIKKDISEGTVALSKDAEDIHMNIEKILIERIGDIGKKLHTARSRNDQVALDIRLYLRQEISEAMSMLSSLCSTIVSISANHIDTIMPGFTHLQPAQPVTLAHHLMAYFEMFKRDIGRLDDSLARINIMPLGSCALAGTGFPIDREMTAKLLKFDGITENSMDAVSDRDFIIEACADISIIMMHLSRFCEEIILWSTFQFAFAEQDDAFSTGSSIMPQKKNPDIAELVRGKTGRVYGNLTSILTIMKSLPLAYNKDMQEDKPALFDSIDTLKLCLPVFTSMLQAMSFNRENMYASAGKGFTNATDLADYLVLKGIPFRTSHELTGRIVSYCLGVGISLESLPIETYKKFSDKISEDIYDFISLESCVNKRNTEGGPSAESVAKHIEKAQNYLETLVIPSYE
jgi:argininosuccinate lyase